MAIDPSSQVRISAMRILGDTGDKRMVRFFKERFKKDNSYRVQAACITSIGKCGSKKDLEFVRKAGKVVSTRNVISNAASVTLKKID